MHIEGKRNAIDAQFAKPFLVFTTNPRVFPHARPLPVPGRHDRPLPHGMRTFHLSPVGRPIKAQAWAELDRPLGVQEQTGLTRSIPATILVWAPIFKWANGMWRTESGTRMPANDVCPVAVFQNLRSLDGLSPIRSCDLEFSDDEPKAGWPF